MWLLYIIYLYYLLLFIIFNISKGNTANNVKLIISIHHFNSNDIVLAILLINGIYINIVNPIITPRLINKDTLSLILCINYFNVKSVPFNWYVISIIESNKIE